MTTGVASELGRLERDFGWRIADRAHLVEGVWQTRGDVATSAFSPHGHHALHDAEERSLWFATRNDLVLQLLELVGTPPSFWDVGAGNGFVARALQGAGIGVVALEPGEAGAATTANRGVSEVICGTLEALELPNAALEGVGLFDVIEHLQDPRPLLQEVRRVLRPGGVLVVTVPALGWLWSDADALAGHARRYRRAELVQQLSDCGFTVIRSTYHFAAAIPPVVVQRLLRGRRRHTNPDQQWEQLEHDLAGQSAATVAIGRAVMRAERTWSRWFRVPFGTSVFAACR